jgi:HSP20 family protein
MDTLFKDFFGTSGNAAPSEHWAPSVDLIDKKDRVLVRATLPGIKKEDLKLSLHENVLTLEGERKRESEHKDSEYYHCETCYGKFYRAMNLPVDVRAEGIEATYKDGILEVMVPKVEKATPKMIDIKGA